MSSEEGPNSGASWELSKENIQPLKGGRRAAALMATPQGSAQGRPGALSLAPSAEKQKEIREAKSEFEASLRGAANSSDPLDPWHRYITWVEQTFPRGGKEGGLNVLLEKCIKEFKDNERCNQDPRYLAVWIKYAAISQTPLEIFSFMYTHKLCTSLPEMYTSWAWELEQAGSVKKAEQVFVKGREKVGGEEAREVLTRAHERFQARVFKHTMESQEEPSGESQEQRAVLGRLQGHGKSQKVGSVRVGDAKKSERPGVLQAATNLPRGNPNSAQSFAIYQDENAGSSSGAGSLLPSMAAAAPGSENLPFERKQNQENVKNPGKWTGAAVGGGRKIPAGVTPSQSKPTFQIHQDEGASKEPQHQVGDATPHKFDSRALAARKTVDPEVPLAVFEPPDPTKRPMYCKHLVYQGTTEFSFEELRAIKFRKRMEERKMERERREIKQLAEDMKAKEEALQREREDFLRQQEGMRRMQEQMMREQEEKMRAMQERMAQEQEENMRRMQEMMMRQQEEAMQRMQQHNAAKQEQAKTPNVGKTAKVSSGGFVVHNDDSTSTSHLQTSSAEVSAAAITAGRKSSLLEDTAALLKADPMMSRSNTSDSMSKKTPPRCDINNVSRMVQPSPTVNTKEALDMVKEMWGKSRRETEPASLGFQIYADKNTPASTSTSTPFPVFTDENAAPPSLAVCTATPPDSAAKPAAPFPVFVDQENAAPASDRPMFSSRSATANDEDGETDSLKENQPPRDTADSEKKPRRQLSGTLLPAAGVPCVPLDVQEAILDEDERDQERKLAAEENEKEASSFEQMPPPPAPAMPPPKNNPNVTIALPSREAFEEMAERMSTPYSGRRNFLPDDEDDFDANTCAVQIISKKRNMGAYEEEERSDDMGGSAAMPKEGAGGGPDVQALLSPIMESSRENYKSTTSSSGASSMSHHHLTSNKSHWGNTQLSLAQSNKSSTLQQHNGTSSKTPGSILSKTPGSILSKTRPIEMTCSSGYMADSSSARTPGTHLAGTASLTGASAEEGGQSVPEVSSAAKKTDAKPPIPVAALSASAELRKELESMTPNADKKRMKMSESFEEDQLEEMTGCIQGMMDQYKKDAVMNKMRMEANQSAAKIKSSFLSESLKESFVAETGKTPLAHADRSAVAKRSLLASISEGPAQDLSLRLDRTQGPLLEESCRIDRTTGRIPQMDKTGGDIPLLDVTAPPETEPVLEDTRPDLELSGCQVLPDEQQPALQESCRETESQPASTPEDNVGSEEDEASIAQQQEELTRNISRLSLLELQDIQDPFDEALQMLLLSRIQMPVSQRHGYHRVASKMPVIGPNREVAIADGTFLTGACKGVGAYGKVFKAMKKGDANETIADMDVVLKVQRPACEWEFYACTELHSRLGGGSRDWFMSIPRCYTYDDGSVFVSEHHQGTLLDVVNVMAGRSKLENEAVAVYFAVEMLFMAERLREAQIVHADIKPDNFLLQTLPSVDRSCPTAAEMFSKIRPALQLIDFGRAIDLKLFPKGKSFVHCYTKEDLRTPEMLDGKPWNYQIDYFGIASTVYVLLSGSYMKLGKNKDGKYFPQGQLKRWWNADLWNAFFAEFLNIPSLEELPDLIAWRERFQEFFYKNKSAKFSGIVTGISRSLHG